MFEILKSARTNNGPLTPVTLELSVRRVERRSCLEVYVVAKERDNRMQSAEYISKTEKGWDGPQEATSKSFCSALFKAQRNHCPRNTILWQIQALNTRVIFDYASIPAGDTNSTLAKSLRVTMGA